MREYRTLARVRTSDKVRRQRRQLAIAELVGTLIKQHGLTDECRQQFVCIFWDEIVGARIAPKTWPVRFADGVLHVETTSSSWVHELQFDKAKLISQIHTWVDALWSGRPLLVADIRFELGMRARRAPLVERDHVQRLKARQLRRLWRPREVVPSAASESECDAIRAETSRIVDPELRALVETVRVKWNR